MQFSVAQFIRRSILFLGAVLCAGYALAPMPPVHAEDFLLNFQQSANDPTLGLKSSNNTPGGVCSGGGGQFLSCTQNGDPTRFEMTFHVIDGATFARVVVGDPATGFAIESYTRISDPAQYLPFNPDGGGNEAAAIGNGAIEQDFNVDASKTTINNRVDPFGRSPAVDPAALGGTLKEGFRVSGNGTQDPRKMVMRMVLSDGQMSQEVFKPILDKKPRISQNVQDGPMQSQFLTDMRGLGYNDKNTAAPVEANVTLNEPGLPAAGAGDFDMALAQKPHVTAGKVAYAPGAGWTTSPGSGGTGTATPQSNSTDAGFNVPDSLFDTGNYDYAEDSFDPLSVDWSDYFDPAQNTVACTNSFSNPSAARGAQAPLSCPGVP